VSTYWDWADVHNADRYLDDLERLGDRNASSAECVSVLSPEATLTGFIRLSEFVKTEFQKSGLPAATQKYTFSVGSTVRQWSQPLLCMGGR
jgi:glycosylphosphatidylinositol transamidase